MLQWCDVGLTHGAAQVHTLKDYNRYCYYVAGLVGVGLSRLFAAGGAAAAVACIFSDCGFSGALCTAGLESQDFADDADKDEKGLSNSMGLFLQKTNIIRDYLEVRARVHCCCGACFAPALTPRRRRTSWRSPRRACSGPRWCGASALLRERCCVTSPRIVATDAARLGFAQVRQNARRLQGA